jgi:acetyl-CoA C-acetyltransferase
VTAGNSCPLNDGAAALTITSDTLAPATRHHSPGSHREHRGGHAFPGDHGLGPVEASRKALEYADMSIGDIDLVEINEAFAAQVIPGAPDVPAVRCLSGIRARLAAISAPQVHARCMSDGKLQV